MKKNNKGFELAELMIIVFIIGLLAAMAIPAFQKIRYTSVEKAIVNGDKVDASTRKWYYEHAWTIEKRNKGKEKSKSPEVIDVTEPGLVQKIEIDGKVFILVPKTEASETEIAGKIYWLVESR